MSRPMTKQEWLSYIEQTWNAVQKEALLAAPHGCTSGAGLGMGGQMNKEYIIKLAREAGFCTLLPSEHIDGTGGIYVGDDDITDSLKRFAALVAAVEREACAKVAEAWPFNTPEQIAAAIRARGDT